MTESTEFVYKRTSQGLVLDPITVQVQPPTKIVHEVDEVKFLNQNPDSIGPPIEDPRSYVGLEASSQMPLGNTYTLQLPIDQGLAGQVLENDGTGQLEWQNGGGIGDVIYTGIDPVPTTRQFAVYDGVEGKKILDSGVTAPPAGSGVVGDVLTLTSPTDSIWSPPVSSGVVGVPPTTIGNLSEWTDATATQLGDSVVVAAEVVQNPVGTGPSGNLAEFGATPEQITDSGIVAANVGNVTGIPPSVGGNLCQFDNALANQISDSGVSVVDLGDVKSSTIPSVNNTAVVYDSTTGKLIKAGGVITIAADEIATTGAGLGSNITISSGQSIFPSFAYGSMGLNYTAAIYPPGGAVSVGLITAGPNIGKLTNIPVPTTTSFGQMYFNGNTGTVTPISAVNTWATVAAPGGYSTSPMPDFSYTTVGNVTTMTYIGTDTITVSCGSCFCWESDSGSSDDATIAIHVNTGGGFVPVQASIQNSKLDNNNFGYPRNGSCRAIFSLGTGHSVAIRVQNNNNTADILVLSLSIDCVEI